ncbi:hypothetical protein HDV62DRAFT_237396 [Trichoderma sp. SZMC 28011]
MDWALLLSLICAGLASRVLGRRQRPSRPISDAYTIQRRICREFRASTRTQYTIRNILCTIIASASLFFLFLQAHAVNASLSACARPAALLPAVCTKYHGPGSTASAAVAGLYRIPHRACFAPAGRPWQPSPGCIGQVSQPLIFSQCQRSFLALPASGRRKKRENFAGIKCMLHAISGVA